MSSTFESSNSLSAANVVAIVLPSARASHQIIGEILFSHLRSAMRSSPNNEDRATKRF